MEISKEKTNKETKTMSEQAITKTEELENVRTAYFLEETLSNLENEIKNHLEEKPRKPTKPVLKTEKASITPYPQVDTSGIANPKTWKKGIKIIGIGIIAFTASSMLMFVIPYLFMFVSVGVLIIMGGLAYTAYLFFSDMKKQKVLKQQYIQQVKQSAEYQNQCRKIDEENQLRQVQLDEQMKQEYSQRLEKYNDALKIYEKELLPPWEEEYLTLQTAKAETKCVLDEVYSKNIIPAQHRNLPAVLYLTTFIGTSQYDLKYAIERYDNHVMQCKQSQQIDLARAQLQVMHETLENQQYANYLHEQMIDMEENNNRVLRSISNWQKADIALREVRRVKAKNAAKRARM